MAEQGSRLLTLAPVEVVTPGTAVQLPTVGQSSTAKTVFLQALSTNEEPVVIGDEKVKAEVGAHGSGKQRGIELAAKATVSIEVIDSATIWVDARKAKDGVAVTVLCA